MFGPSAAPDTAERDPVGDPGIEAARFLADVDVYKLVVLVCHVVDTEVHSEPFQTSVVRLRHGVEIEHVIGVSKLGGRVRIVERLRARRARTHAALVRKRILRTPAVITDPSSEHRMMQI